MAVKNENELISRVREALIIDDSGRVGLAIGPVRERHFTVFDEESGETYIVSVHNLVVRKNSE